MVWLPLATITPDKDWTFTAPVTGSLFRVRHSVTPSDDLRQGYIAQASGFAPVELMGIKRLYSKQQYDIYHFDKPDCWTERTIAVRNGYYYSPNSWTVSIDVWQSAEETAKSFQELAETVAKIAKLIELLL